MAISKQKKTEIMDTYLKVLSKASGLIVTEYRGFAMKNFNATRAELRKVQGAYTVTKNTIFKRALKETGFAAPDDLFAGPTAVAIAFGDLSTVTKTVLQRAKDDDKLILKGAVMGEMVFHGKEGVETLSTLPTLDEARATLMGLLLSPAQQFVSLVNQPAQGVAQILKAYTDKLQGGESSGDAA
ncbi:MAG: 50S ribosomal protein L10 [Anaerolineae bacterium]|nr:50S ribosomal protein L10 [Anaerolineae bacterium]